MSTFVDKSLPAWEYEMTRIFFKLKDTCETFDADTVYRESRAIGMAPQFIKKLSGALFKRFQASGYIERTGAFKLSERNGSSPLPVWRKRVEREPLTQLQKTPEKRP